MKPDQLLDNNKQWARRRLEADPEYFQRLAGLQQPRFLWIGCSDSRVPANEITGTQPGEIFVHRNVANLVVHTDVNLLTVLEYAVNHLKVEHVIVCGHYGCGGVTAAMAHRDLGVINTWLRSIKDVYRLHELELLRIADPQLRLNRLTELNIEEQVLNLAKTSVIQRAWKQDRRPSLHGWAYGLDNGRINPLVEMLPGHPVDHIYTYEDL